MFENKWMKLAFFSPLGGLLIYGFLQFILASVFSLNKGMTGSEMGGSSGASLYNMVSFIFTLLIVLFMFGLFIGFVVFLLIYLKRTFFPHVEAKQVLKQLISGVSTSTPPPIAEKLDHKKEQLPVPADNS